jgi:hypothetical protein
MPNPIKIKRSNTAGVVPTTLVDGEIAINQADKKLFYRDSLGVVQSFSLVKIPPPTLTNPTTTAETVLVRWTLPANFLSAGMAILANASLLSAGTGTVIWRLRVGSAGTVADTLVCQLTTSVAQLANARGSVFFNIYVPSITNINASGHAIMQNAILGHLTGSVVNATVVPTAPIFLSVTAQISVAAANVITGAGINVAQ